MSTLNTRRILSRYHNRHFVEIAIFKHSLSSELCIIGRKKPARVV